MNRCTDFQRLMDRSLDGEISQGEKTLLDRHMTMCEDCAREFKALQLGLDMLASMPVPEPDAGFTSETVKKAFRAKKILAHRQKVMAWFLAGLAAIISALILASWPIIFQPALKWTALNLLSVLSESKIILMILRKLLSTLAAVLIPLGDDALRLLCQGTATALYGYLISLMILLFFILIKRTKSTALCI
jgi:predicted anti-sigma-YlaC factor YlaD